MSKQVRFAVYMKAFVVIDEENGLIVDEYGGNNVDVFRRSIENEWDVDDVIEHTKATNWDIMSQIESAEPCGIEEK